jgi:inhibitor of cysteine peptidase
MLHPSAKTTESKMPAFKYFRLLPMVGLVLLAACAQKPPSPVVQKSADKGDCPRPLQAGQHFLLSLPSNPTTGYRWEIARDAGRVLRSLGPEVYINPEDAGLVGSAGKSTWRFLAWQPGEDQLLMHYRRPWDVGVAPAKTLDCMIRVK